jgi:hypothetical protein
MRKILLFSVLFMATVSMFAQNVRRVDTQSMRRNTQTVQNESMAIDAIKLKTEDVRQKSIVLNELQLPANPALRATRAISSNTVLFSSDFSDASQWTISNGNATTRNWVIGTTAPSGDYPISAIASTTASNGFALFDSDLLCGASDAFLTTANPIDCSGEAVVVLTFETYLRKFNDQFFVRVSNDGTTWTSFELFGTLANNGSTANPEVVMLDISSVAANQATVHIRFNYVGNCGYSWMIDDVQVLTAPPPVIAAASFGGLWSATATTPVVYAQNFYYWGTATNATSATWAFNTYATNPTALANNVTAVTYTASGNHTATFNITGLDGNNYSRNATNNIELPAPGLEDVVWNILPGEGVTTSTFSANNFVAGANSNYNRVAERFELPSDVTVHMDALEFFLANYQVATANQSRVCTIRIYSANPTTGLPGTVLATFTPTAAQVFGTAAITNQMSGRKITFAEPVEITGTFFVEFDLSNWGTASATNRIGFAHTPNRTFPYSTAFAFFSGAWRDLSGLVTGFASSIYIAPSISIAPAAANDATITAITSPANGVNLTATETVTATIKNNGTNAITTMDLELTVNGTVIALETYTGNIASGATANYTFTATADLSAAGNHTINVRAILIDDENPANDSYSVTITNTICNPVTTFPFFESMEDGIPVCWLNIDADGDGHKWQFFAPYGVAISYSWQSTPLTPDNWLITPQLVLDANDYTLTFIVAPLDPDYPAEQYSVLVSTTGTNLADFTAIHTETLTEADAEGKVVTLDLAAYSEESIYIAFRHWGSTDEFAIILFDILVDFNLDVLALSPADMATNVPLDATVSVTFNQDITAGDLSGITFSPSVTGVSASVSGAVLTIAHADFAQNTEYTVTVPAGAIDGYNQVITWKFTTESQSGVGLPTNELGNVLIYPNPVSSKLSIQSSNASIQRVEIYNLQGQLVKLAERDLNEILVNDMASGIYTIKIITDKGTAIQRFVKE